jgi:hypothetical protein
MLTVNCYKGKHQATSQRKTSPVSRPRYISSIVLELYAGWDKPRAIGIYTVYVHYTVQKLQTRDGKQRGDSIIDGWSKVVLKWFEQNLIPNATYWLATRCSSAFAYWSDPNLFNKVRFLLSVCNRITSSMLHGCRLKQMFFFILYRTVHFLSSIDIAFYSVEAILRILNCRYAHIA